MRLAIEYGDGHVDVDLPDDTRVISPDHAEHEPPPLADPVAATREALADPLGTGPIGDLVSRRRHRDDRLPRPGEGRRP